MMQQEKGNFYQSPFGNIPPISGVGTAPTSDPFGGLQADEQIDGVSVKDLAAVIGQNAMYYLPRFKAMQETGKKKIPNFAAFIFSVPWLFFRRMYLYAFGLLLANAALYLPNVFIILYAVNNPDAVQIPSTYMWANMVCTLLMWGLQVFMCFFGNQFYMNHCLKLARQLKSQTSSDEEYAALAQKHGGVRAAFLYIFAGLYLASSCASFFFML